MPPPPPKQPNKFEELGGSYCSCFQGGCTQALYGCFLFPVAYAEALEKGGENCGLGGSLGFIFNAGAIVMIPGWIPFVVAYQMQRIEHRLGGNERYKRLCWDVCCWQCCVACQFLRAMDKAEEQGLLKRGSPEGETMER